MSRRNIKVTGLILIFFGLFWLRKEEISTTWVYVFGVLVALWVNINVTYLKTNTFQIESIIIPFSWSVIPIIIFLMILKNGIHGHGFPEYSLLQTKKVLAGMPIWLLLGYFYKYTISKISI